MPRALSTGFLLQFRHVFPGTSAFQRELNNIHLRSDQDLNQRASYNWAERITVSRPNTELNLNMLFICYNYKLHFSCIVARQTLVLVFLLTWFMFKV